MEDTRYGLASRSLPCSTPSGNCSKEDADVIPGLVIRPEIAESGGTRAATKPDAAGEGTGDDTVGQAGTVALNEAITLSRIRDGLSNSVSGRKTFSWVLSTTLSTGSAPSWIFSLASLILSNAASRLTKAFLSVARIGEAAFVSTGSARFRARLKWLLIPLRRGLSIRRGVLVPGTSGHVTWE